MICSMTKIFFLFIFDCSMSTFNLFCVLFRYLSHGERGLWMHFIKIHNCDKNKCLFLSYCPIRKHLHLIRQFVRIQIMYTFYILLTLIYEAILWPDLPHWGRNDPPTAIYLIILTESELTWTHIEHYKSSLWKTKQPLPNVLTQIGSSKYVSFSILD